MAETVENEVIVVGGGPGGYAAAFHLADKGKQVTLINDTPKPGGTCLHVGCIPSKALLHVAKLLTDVKDASALGLDFGKPKIDVEQVRKHWKKVVGNLANGLEYLCKGRKVEFVQSRAKLIDGSTLELSDGSRRKFQHCILATGSSPTVPGPLRIESDKLMTSTEALELQGVPGSLLIVGGGYIGLELGYVYAAMNCKVTVVEMMDTLLPGVDPDLVRPLKKRLSSMFENIYLKTQVQKLEETGNGIKASFKSEAAGEVSETFDRVLIAVGRYPNSKNLGLEVTDIEVDEQGFIITNDQCRTGEEKIFAIGDVAGQPMLAHKASYEGKVAAEVILGEPAVIDYRAVPAVVFTDPEIAWAGLTETDAAKDGIEAATVRYPWSASGRAMTLDRTEGMTKLLVEPKTERVLGVGIVGRDAGELIAEATLAIEMGATARDIAMTIHAHPTLSETVMEGAEMYYGEATHAMPPKKRGG